MAATAKGQHPDKVRHSDTVQVDHPDSRLLSQEEQALLERCRSRLQARLNSAGLTVDDLGQQLKAMHDHPEARVEVIRIMREEASALMPGQSQFNFDWD